MIDSNTVADVVVIGTGGAGYSAAITAHDLGAKVVMLERMPITGGNTQIASGGMNAAGELGGSMLATSPAEFARLITEDAEKWRRVVTLASLRS